MSAPKRRINRVVVHIRSSFIYSGKVPSIFRCPGLAKPSRTPLLTQDGAICSSSKMPHGSFSAGKGGSSAETDLMPPPFCRSPPARAHKEN